MDGQPNNADFEEDCVIQTFYLNATNGTTWGFNDIACDPSLEGYFCESKWNALYIGVVQGSGKEWSGG